MVRSYSVVPHMGGRRAQWPLSICRDKPASKIISWLLTEEAGGKIDSHQCPSVLATLRLDAFVMDFILEGKKPRLRLGNSRKTVSWLLIARTP